MRRRDRKRSLAGVIAAMAVVNLVYGITFPLLALVLDAQGVSKTLIGLSTIVGHITFAMLIRVERSGIDIDIWVEFLDGDRETPRLKEFCEGSGNDAFA